MSWRVMGASYYPFGFVNPPDHLTVENDTTHETVRYVPERTCHFEEYESTGIYVCSECGATAPEDFTVYYCWCCGAKVV